MIGHRVRLVILACVCAALLATLGRTAQAAPAWPPSPDAFLGHRVGADFRLAHWDQIVGYFRALDTASDRVLVRELGKSTEGQPIILAFIGSPETIRNLDRMRAQQAKLADPRTLSAADEAALVRDGTIVVWVNCGLHSSEVGASQMAMELAYRLATGEDERTREIRERCLILLMPSANPDGNVKVADWYERYLGTPFEDAPMPWLYQKYIGHDDNRDWFMVTQQETRILTQALYREWFPTIIWDVHQMGSNGARLFVPPFYDPVNPNVPPVLNQSLQMVGGHMVEALSAAGKTGVVTGAIYDNWWQGGFRTSAYRHNLVGLLTEAASANIASPIFQRFSELRGGARGLDAYAPRVNFPEPWPGGWWRLRDIIDYEEVAAMSLFTLAARYRDTLLGNQLALGQDAIRKGQEEPPFAFLVPPDQRDAGSAARMLRTLQLQGIEVHRARAAFTADSVAYPAGTAVLLCAQPFRSHLKDLLERQEYPERRLFPGGPAEGPYDVAGWTLPLQKGVRCVTAVAPFTADLERVDEVTVPKRTVTGLGATAKKQPRLALYQPWTGSMDEGWTRWVLEQYGIAYTTLHNAEVRAGGLRDRYDCILIADQSGSSILNGVAPTAMPAPYAGGIGADGVIRLQEFVEAGGTLVLMDSATDLAIQQFGVPVKNALDGLDRTKFFCPGSVLRITVDTTHPLGAGFDTSAAAYFINSRAFTVSPEALKPDPTHGNRPRVRVVASYSDTVLLLSGWCLGEEYLKGKPAICEADYGKGHIVLFGFRVQHRAQTEGTFPFLFNAIYRSMLPE